MIQQTSGTQEGQTRGSVNVPNVPPQTTDRPLVDSYQPTLQDMMKARVIREEGRRINIPNSATLYNTTQDGWH